MTTGSGRVNGNRVRVELVLDTSALAAWLDVSSPRSMPVSELFMLVDETDSGVAVERDLVVGVSVVCLADLYRAAGKAGRERLLQLRRAPGQPVGVIPFIVEDLPELVEIEEALGVRAGDDQTACPHAVLVARVYDATLVTYAPASAGRVLPEDQILDLGADGETDVISL